MLFKELRSMAGGVPPPPPPPPLLPGRGPPSPNLLSQITDALKTAFQTVSTLPRNDPRAFQSSAFAAIQDELFKLDLTTLRLINLLPSDELASLLESAARDFDMDLDEPFVLSLVRDLQRTNPTLLGSRRPSGDPNNPLTGVLRSAFDVAISPMRLQLDRLSDLFQEELAR